MAKRWYVVHTYSGYENKVKTDLEHRIEIYGLEDKVVDIQIPTEQVTELKDGAFLDCNTLKTITIGKTLRDKLVSDNCWGYTTNFGENPHLRLVLKNGEVSLPPSVKVM